MDLKSVYKHYPLYQYQLKQTRIEFVFFFLEGKIRNIINKLNSTRGTEDSNYKALGATFQKQK